jgi:pimeloyl-ACP methyl ester carboxylesterase
VAENPTGGASGWRGLPPATKYARVGGDRLAYQVLGQGPPDLVFTMGAFSHVDIVWEDPQMALFLRRLASFSRLLRFDRRGTGVSDPLPRDPLPPWEAYAEELVAVMDAVGSQRAALLATGPQAGPMALFFAGTRPERTGALILADATARYLVADDYPIGFPPEAAEVMIARSEELWGTEAMAGSTPPVEPAMSGFCAGRPGWSGPSPAHGWCGPTYGRCWRSTSAPSCR